MWKYASTEYGYLFSVLLIDKNLIFVFKFSITCLVSEILKSLVIRLIEDTGHPPFNIQKILDVASGEHFSARSNYHMCSTLKTTYFCFYIIFLPKLKSVQVTFI